MILKPLRKLNPNEESMEILNLHAGAFNVVTVSKIIGKIDEVIIRKVLDFIQEESDFLQCKIEQVYNQFYFTNSGLEKEKINLKVISYLEKNTFIDIVKEELNKAIPSDKYLIRCLIVYENKTLNYCYLITTIHHAICDAISCINLHSKILSYYRRIRDCEPLHHSYSEMLGSWTEFMPRHTLGIRGKIKNILFIAQILTRAWFSPSEKLKQEKFVPPDERECGIVQKRIDSTITRKLIAISRQELTTFHSTICAATLLAVANRIRKDRNLHAKINVSCKTFVDLRRRIKPSIPFEQLGHLVGSVDSFHCLSSSISFWDLAREVNQKIKQKLQREIYFPDFLLFRKKVVEHYINEPDEYPLTVGVSNVGDLKLEKDYGSFQLEEIWFIPSNPLFGGVLTVTVSTHDDKTILNFVASIPSVSQTTIEHLASDVTNCLESVIPSAVTISNLFK